MSQCIVESFCACFAEIVVWCVVACVVTGVCDQRRGSRDDDMAEERALAYNREVGYGAGMYDTMRRHQVSAVPRQRAQRWTDWGLNPGPPAC